MGKKFLIGAGFWAILLTVAGVAACKKSQENTQQVLRLAKDLSMEIDSVVPPELPFASIPVTRLITMADYFRFMDELVHQYDALTPYPLSEHLLVRANPWLIDSLENTDYYRQVARGNFIVDQRKMPILKPGDTLRLPAPQVAARLLSKMNSTWLDVNLPAFRLRILEKDSVVYAFPVRIGKNEQKFLALAGGRVDLRTHTGTGKITRISRDPVFYDPVTGKQFTHTRRDDGKTTRMPLIPWIEPSINGRRYGQMVHPTTNPRTLGKAASNGCIGLKEADAWRVYYHAPVGTQIVIRYDLMEINPQGDTLRYKDIYHLAGSRKKSGVQAVLHLPGSSEAACWCGL